MEELIGIMTMVAVFGLFVYGCVHIIWGDWD